MDTPVLFRFRNKGFRCFTYIDNTNPPSFIFIELLDQELVREFGEEVTIKTDFEKRLPKKDDYPALISLRQAIFDALSTIPEFLIAKRRAIAFKQVAKNGRVQSV